MARQRVTVIGLGPVAISPALVGIAILGFPAGLVEKAADTVCYLTCALSGVVLQALLEMIFVVARGLESGTLERGWIFFCGHLLVSLGPLL